MDETSYKIYASQEWVKEMLTNFDSSTQSDWEQNDENANDYVKNRTHWEEPLVTNTLVDNVSVTIPDSPPYVVDPFTIDIVVGTTYLVTFDDVVYECVAQNDPYLLPSIGNLGSLSPSISNTGEPFLIRSQPGTIMLSASSGTHTITIQEVVGGGVHKIDSKYIPTPDWNASVNEAGYIANRTHWTEFINFSAVYNVSPTLTDNGNGLYISEPITCETLNIGQTVIVIWDNVSYECIVLNGPNNIVYIGNPYLLFANMGAPDSGEPFAIQCLPEAIVFGCNVLPTSSSSLTIIKKVEVVHKIDNKYLPDLPDFPQNILDGSVTGSIRGIGTDEESETYTMGNYAFAEGRLTAASGHYSHAEGVSTTASGEHSHAEGQGTTASDSGSHAEGGHTTASGGRSHAEGVGTTASGNSSHAEGYYTIAGSNYQHVQGECNIEDTENKYAHIVGNGTQQTPSNAHTLDWDGNAWFAGNIKIGGTGQTDTAASLIATQNYVLEQLEVISADEITSICS